MTEARQPPETVCPVCGRRYTGRSPAFCISCGTPLAEAPTASAEEPTGPGRPAGVPAGRRRRFRVVAVAVLAAVLLACGAAAGALLLIRRGDVAIELPKTASELRSSIRTCEEYLSDDGRRLARGRADGASVYSVEARLDPAAGTLSADQVVLFTNRTGVELDRLVFRVYANGPQIRGKKSEVAVSSPRAGGREATASLEGSILTLTPSSPLAPGARTLVSFSFEEGVPEVRGAAGALEEMLGGETDGGYGVFGHDGKIFDLGYFMPLLTAFEDGNWHTGEVPAFGDAADYDCSYFNVSLDVPAGWEVAGSGRLTGRSGSRGRVVHAFAGGPLRDFALQASPDYRSASRAVGPTTVTSWYLEEAKGGGEKALNVAADALSQFNRRFGQYPYTGLNVCQAALGGGAAGMEFSGIIQVSRALYGAGTTPDLGELGEQFNELLDSLGGTLLADTLEFVIAHEVCHQWWGLAVGSDSIEHPWQDESLTNFCAILYFRWQHGEEAADRQLQVQLKLPYRAAAMLGSEDAVVDSPVSAFENQEQYTAVVYSKGALFFSELEKEMGPTGLVRALARYYRDHAFLIAEPADLVRALEEAADDAGSVTALHQRWIKETHGDEDIRVDIPGAELLDDLFEDLPDLDLGPYRDLLEDLLEEFDMGGEDGSPVAPLPGESSGIPI